METKQIEVKLSVLKTIYTAMLPIHYRLDSLLEDLVNKTIKLSETDKAVLLEYCSCSGALKILFEDYFETFEHLGPEQSIALPYQEYITIMSLSKTVELSTRTSLGGSSVLEH